MAEIITETPLGPLRGILSKDGSVARFIGIKYATVPARFSHSILDDELSSSVRDCTQPGKVAVQWQIPASALAVGKAAWGAVVGGMLPSIPDSQAEQCCFLNVTAPQSRGGGTPLPVMVWIHGGAFVMGSGSSPLYRSSSLARRGCVLVTINYRLGCFGNLKLPGGDANCGLWDQASSAPMINSALLQRLRRSITSAAPVHVHMRIPFPARFAAL